MFVDKIVNLLNRFESFSVIRSGVGKYEHKRTLISRKTCLAAVLRRMIITGHFPFDQRKKLSRKISALKRLSKSIRVFAAAILMSYTVDILTLVLRATSKISQLQFRSSSALFGGAFYLVVIF